MPPAIEGEVTMPPVPREEEDCPYKKNVTAIFKSNFLCK
jgi:hypothetical protein